EEVGVARERIRKRSIAPRFPLTTKDFWLTTWVSDDLDNFTVPTCANTARGFTTACTPTPGLSKTLSTHTLIGLLRNFCSQIRTADTNVNDLETQRGCVRTHLFGHFTHHGATLLGQRGFETTQTVDAAQSCIETGAKTLFSQRHATRNGQ